MDNTGILKNVSITNIACNVHMVLRRSLNGKHS